MLYSLLALICLCTACSRAATPTPAPFTPTTAPSATAQPSSVPPTITPEPTVLPEPQTQAYDYKVIYTDGGFSIREAYLGADAIWKDDFKMPQAHIENTATGLGLGRDMTCEEQPGSPPLCTQSFEIPLEKGGEGDKYVLHLATVRGGTGTLYKNGKLIWSGSTNGANSFAILSSMRLGDEIVFDYSKSNWGTDQGGRLWITPSILLSQGNAVKLIPEAFAPQVIKEKLIYFKIYKSKETLVFDGQARGEAYDEVFNQLCCWHGPPIGIANNGDFIDFFAQKGNDWYHVQAGYLPGVK